MRSEYCKGLAADSKVKVVCLVRILQVYVNILQLNKTVSEKENNIDKYINMDNT